MMSKKSSNMHVTGGSQQTITALWPYGKQNPKAEAGKVQGTQVGQTLQLVQARSICLNVADGSDWQKQDFFPME